MFRRLSVSLAVLFGLLAFSAPAGADPVTPTLTVTPNPTAAFYAGAETFSGCGYEPGIWVDAYVTPPGASWGSLVGAGPVDAGGCISIVTSGWVGAAGDYLAETVTQVQTGQTVKNRKLAESMVAVV